MLLCAHTRPKEALVLSLGRFHIRINGHLLAYGPRKGLFLFLEMHAYRAPVHAEGTLLEGKSAHSGNYD